MRRALLQHGLKDALGDEAHVVDAVQVAGENLAEALVEGHPLWERCTGGGGRDGHLGVNSVCAPAGFLIFFVGCAQGFPWIQPGSARRGLGVAFGGRVARSGGLEVPRGAVVVRRQRWRSGRARAGGVKVAVVPGRFPGWRGRRRESGALLPAGCAVAEVPAVGGPVGRSGELPQARVCALGATGWAPGGPAVVREGPGIRSLWRKDIPVAASCGPALLQVASATPRLSPGRRQAFPLGRQVPGQGAKQLVLSQALDCPSDASLLQDVCGHGQGGEFL